MNNVEFGRTRSDCVGGGHRDVCDVGATAVIRFEQGARDRHHYLLVPRPVFSYFTSYEFLGTQS